MWAYLQCLSWHHIPLGDTKIHIINCLYSICEKLDREIIDQHFTFTIYDFCFVCDLYLVFLYCEWSSTQTHRLINVLSWMWRYGSGEERKTCWINILMIFKIFGEWKASFKKCVGLSNFSFKLDILQAKIEEILFWRCFNDNAIFFEWCPSGLALTN